MLTIVNTKPSAVPRSGRRSLVHKTYKAQGSGNVVPMRFLKIRR
jgi:hypothetical protein